MVGKEGFKRIAERAGKVRKDYKWEEYRVPPNPPVGKMPKAKDNYRRRKKET